MTPPDYPAPKLVAPAPPANAGAGRPMTTASDSDLARRTLRTVAILVAACVVFVGALSVVAVTLTSRAVGTGARAAERGADDTSTKKPLSI